MISVQHVDFSIPQKQILQDLSFSLATTGITALVGHNGAGKTTLIRLLSGYIQPSTGSILISGQQHPHPHIRSNMGVLSEDPPLYDELVVGEYLAFIASIRGVQSPQKSIRWVLELLGLQSVEDDYLSTLSKGFRQRVGLAQALLHKPSILILDEPFVGLDPLQKQTLRNTLTKISQDCLILLSSHNLDDIEQIAQDILFLEKGRLLFHKNIASLQMEQNQYFAIIYKQAISVTQMKTLLSLDGISKIIPRKEGLLTESNDVLYSEFFIHSTEEAHLIFSKIVHWSREQLLEIEEFYRYKPRLEEILLS